VSELAREFLVARATRREIAVPPSQRGAAFDLDAAYAVEAEIARALVESGRRIAGRKVGYANKGMWRILKLETLLWAHMYDDTVHRTEELSASAFHSAKIEPEIVFKLKQPLAGVIDAAGDAVSALEAVEWMALGFEIVDCPFPNWKFAPVDFVAAWGLHAALVLGEPHRVQSSLLDSLAGFKLRLLKNGELVEEGSGKNSLRSPALCLTELAVAAARRGDPLASGELISTGTLTSALAIAPGETWRAEVEGLPVEALELRIA
jgi:2-oxo-3-hexenedioate decarboxylase